MTTPSPLPRLGVVVVTYASAPVIEACLSSLFQSEGVALHIVVADNASPDATLDAVRAMALAVPGPHQLEVLETGGNLGFAGGVNAGLRALLSDAGLDRFWILNPDAIAEPGAAAAFATHPAPDGFSLMGGRVLYADAPNNIQIDGGTIDRVTGRTGNLNLGRPSDTPPPDVEQIDFVTGASMVASRAFVEQAGPMEEGYFLYYEEVDWALRRGDLPILYCPDGVVVHQAGTAIGSPTLDRGASAFSLWFKHRARLMFVRKHFSGAIMGAAAYSVAKAGQALLRGQFGGAWAIMSGSFGLGMPASVRRRLGQTKLPRFGDGPGRF